VSSHISLHGKAAACSPGIVIGRVQKIGSGQRPIPENNIDADQVEAEIERLNEAIVASVADLDAERLHLLDLESQEPLHILDAQRLMLLDPDLSQKVSEIIRKKRINAVWALRQQMDIIGAVFENIDDPYLRTKKMDVEHIGSRILCHLVGEEREVFSIHGEDPVVLVSEDFTPLEVMRFWREGAAGFIAEQGAANAHSIIIARGVGMPALMGADAIMNQVTDGDQIILDGEQGLWISNPKHAALDEYHHLVLGVKAAQEGLRSYASKPSVSADGYALKLMANLEVDDEVPLALELGVEGVGLYRTEFLLYNADRLPGEDEQYQHYSRIVRAMAGRQVTFRLIDVGGEKPILFEQITGHDAASNNPSLGLRGIRLLLRNRQMLKTQLMALLRAATEGEVQILIPMVSHPDEVIQVRELLHECAASLGIDTLPPVGAMIEVPAAVMIADELAKLCDFFSVGTNDLIQYTMAADRTDEDVAYLYDASHQAMEYMLRRTARAAKKAGIPIAMCGEMAADLGWTERLMNMGFDSLSMSLHHILPVRKHLSHLYYRPETG